MAYCSTQQIAPPRVLREMQARTSCAEMVVLLRLGLADAADFTSSWLPPSCVGSRREVLSSQCEHGFLQPCADVDLVVPTV